MFFFFIFKHFSHCGTQPRVKYLVIPRCLSHLGNLGFLFLNFLFNSHQLTIDLLKIPFSRWHSLLLTASNPTTQTKWGHSLCISCLPTFHCYRITNILGRESGCYLLLLVGALLDNSPAALIEDNVTVLVSLIFTQGLSSLVKLGLLLTRLWLFVCYWDNCDVQMGSCLVHVQNSGYYVLVTKLLLKPAKSRVYPVIKPALFLELLHGFLI